MKFFASIFALVAMSGFTLAQEYPCYNQAAPNQGIGNYCQCADNTCWYRSDQDNGCDPVGNPITECPTPAAALKVKARAYTA